MKTQSEKSRLLPDSPLENIKKKLSKVHEKIFINKSERVKVEQFLQYDKDCKDPAYDLLMIDHVLYEISDDHEYIHAIDVVDGPVECKSGKFKVDECEILVRTICSEHIDGVTNVLKEQEPVKTLPIQEVRVTVPQLDNLKTGCRSDGSSLMLILVFVSAILLQKRIKTKTE